MKLKFPVLITIMVFWFISGVQAQTQTPPRVVTALDWSPNGRTIAVAYGIYSEQACVRDENLYGIEIIETATGSVNQDLKRHTCTVNSIEFNSMGSRVASGGDDTRLIVWDTVNGINILQSNREASEVTKISWSPNDDEIMFIMKGIGVGFRDSSGQEQSGGLFDPEGSPFTDTVWGPDSATVATSREDGTVRVWDSSTGETLIEFRGHMRQVNTLAWNPANSSNLIASGDVDGIIKIWNGETGEEVVSIDAHQGAVNDLAWSADGQTLASAGDDGQVYLWQIQDGTVSKVASYAYGAAVYALAWSPDGTKLAYGGQGIDGQDGRVEISEVNIQAQTQTPTPVMTAPG